MRDVMTNDNNTNAAAYAVTLVNGDEDRFYSRLHDATTRADKLAGEGAGEVKVLHLATAAVVYATSVSAVSNRDLGVHFTPWTRIENPKHVAPDFAGFVPAYTRKRIQAVVYRKADYERGAAGMWRVFDARSGNYVDVDSTKEACSLTKEMRLGRVL